MDLTTVAALKAFLSIRSESDDALIASLITAESDLIAKAIDRPVAVASHSDIFSGSGQASHRFRHAPVRSVSRVLVGGSEIPEAGDITEQGYLLDGDGLLLLFGYRFAWGERNCRIDYTAGWEEVPEALAHACLELVAYRYRSKDRYGLMSQGLAGETTAYETKAMPEHVRALIDPYRRVVA